MQTISVNSNKKTNDTHTKAQKSLAIIIIIPMGRRWSRQVHTQDLRIQRLERTQSPPLQRARQKAQAQYMTTALSHGIPSPSTLPPRGIAPGRVA